MKAASVVNKASKSHLAAPLSSWCASLPGWTWACTCSPSWRRPLAAPDAGPASAVFACTGSGNGPLCFREEWLRVRVRPPSTASCRWRSTPCAWWRVRPGKTPRRRAGWHVVHTPQTHWDWPANWPSLQENIQQQPTVQFIQLQVHNGAFQGLHFDLVASSGKTLELNSVSASCVLILLYSNTIVRDLNKVCLNLSH